MPFSFLGKTEGYYRVFVFNTLMTLLTLGLYSPWAKVRKLRYLCGNVSLLGGTFDFDAKPVVILISRLFVVLLLTTATFFDNILEFLPGLGYGSVLIAGLIPFAIVRGRSFMARHTLYKGVRFAYRRQYGQVLVLVLAPSALLAVALYSITKIVDNTTLLGWARALAAPLVLTAALWPLWPWLLHRSLVSQLRLGNLEMSFQTAAWKYVFQLHVTAVLLVAVCMALVFLSFAVSFAEPYEDFSTVLVVAPAVVVTFGYCLISAQLTKLFWQSIKLTDGSAVLCNLNELAYARVLFSNLLLTVLSLGILYPWAQVRKWRWLFNSLEICLGTSLGKIASGQTAAETALGAEFGELVGLDIDVGLI